MSVFLWSVRYQLGQVHLIMMSGGSGGAQVGALVGGNLIRHSSKDLSDIISLPTLELSLEYLAQFEINIFQFTWVGDL